MHPYGEAKPAGLARAMFETVRAAIEADSNNRYLVYLKRKPASPLPIQGANWQAVPLNHGKLFFTRAFSRAPQADINVFLTPVVPLFFRPRKCVVVVYDFAYKYAVRETFKQWLYHRVLHWINASALRRADRVVAISEFTKQETIKFFGTPAEKIEVIPLAYNDIRSNDPEPVPGAPEPFFLFAGVLKERKNVLNVIRGFEVFSQSDNRHSLIVAGKKTGAYYPVLEKYVRDHNLSERVRFVDHMTDRQLAWLYPRATGFVFPSLLEGFGMPILEAMGFGTPVITADRGATAEVAAEAALLVDPEDPVAIASAMARLSGDANLRERLRQKGFERIKAYTWPAAGRQYRELFAEISGNKNTA